MDPVKEFNSRGTEGGEADGRVVIYVEGIRQEGS